LNVSLSQNRRRLFSAFYIASVAAGTATLGWLAWKHVPTSSDTFGWVFFFLILLFADTKMAEAQMRGGGRVLSSRTLDLSMVVLFGPLVACVAEVLSAVFRGIILKSSPPKKVFFNASMLVLAAASAGLVYEATPFNERFDSPLFLIPLLAALLTYSMVNTFMVTTIMSLDRGIPFREIWFRDFSWSGAKGMMEVPFTAMVILLYMQAGAWTLLIYLPIIAVIYMSAKAVKSTREAHMASIAVLATTLEVDEPYTHGHSYRVAQYSVSIGRAMGMSPRELETMEIGGLLHDIGKIAITNDIICKPGRLTSEEFSTLAEHPAIGARIVEQIKFLPDTVDLVRHHHERVDGKGYPDGLSGDEISLGASIMMVADAFDAMTSDRSYRKALPIDRALGELQKYSGTQFRTDVVETILAMHERGEFDIIPDSDIQQVICEIQRVSDPDTKTKVQPQPAPQATHDEPVEKQVETEVHTVP
jgi:putative nucleotidyltransferase with HDIG domain